MRTPFFLLALCTLAISCEHQPGKPGAAHNPERRTISRIYSKAVHDSFSVFLQLPKDYRAEQKKKYPVIYMLDANFFFDIIATTIDKYTELGAMPPVILVGVGYRDFKTMDSLRSRDYTYPTALPQYEMSPSGGADKFFTFIKTEHIPQIDNSCGTDTSNRILMGHSLGGYFTMYAMLQYLSGNDHSFSGYVAASPSIEYNYYYLVKELNALKPLPSPAYKRKIYITFEGVEETDKNPGEKPTSEVMPMLADYFTKNQSATTIYKADLFSNLEHMDTPFPSFTKGFTWILDKEESK